MTDQMPPTAPEGPPPLGVQLGLGATWAPAPVAWGFQELHGPTGEKIHVVQWHTTAGVFGVAMDAESLRNFIRQAQEQLSGLTLPPGALAAPNGTPGL